MSTHVTHATKKPLGRTGVEVPAVGQGTWQMEGDDRDAALEALRRGIELGLTHLDTAEMYGRGKVESLLGELLRGEQGLRDRLYLVSKVSPSNASRQGVVRACEASLKRLGTDRLDLYLLHWRGGEPLEETVAGFASLVEAGKIRAWGVSNFDVDDLEELVARSGGSKVACNQVLYHLQERSIEHRVGPWCAKHGVALVGYSPFGSGRFPEASTRGGAALAEIAEAHGATPRAVALAFLTRAPHLFTIPKTSRRAHVEENARAAGLTLDDAEVARIDAAFPVGKDRGLPML